MKAIKKVGHNAVICKDKNGKEVVAFGKGIGFPQIPYEVELSKIERTYYDVKPQYYSLINEIPEEIFEISRMIVDYAKKCLKKQLNSNLVFTLADHIHFTVQRYRENITFKVPFNMDVEYFYETEMMIARKSVRLINQRFHLQLPDNEAVGIALHLINSRYEGKLEEHDYVEEDLIVRITEIIEVQFGREIDKKSFNYSRFVSHLQYLIKRITSGEIIDSDNKKIYEALKTENAEIYECVMKIKRYLDEKMECSLSDEECLYLLLHLNRLFSREYE